MEEVTFYLMKDQKKVLGEKSDLQRAREKC